MVDKLTQDSENSIVVTIPFERLETKTYVPVNDKNVPVQDENVPVRDENVPDKEDKLVLILEFCHEPKSVLEIADYLGYKDKRSVRKYLNVLLSQGRISMTILRLKSKKCLQSYICSDTISAY